MGNVPQIDLLSIIKNGMNKTKAWIGLGKISAKEFQSSPVLPKSEFE